MKKTVGLAALLSVANVAQAADLNQNNQNDIKVSLSGRIHSQVGSVGGTKFFNYRPANYDADHKDYDPPSPENGKLNRRSLVNDTSLTIKAEGEIENLKYGGEVKLNTDTSVTKDGSDKIANRTMIFVETEAGRVELGSYNGATDNMKVSAVNLARATGGIDGDWIYWINPSTSVTESGREGKGESIYASYILGTYLPVGSEYTSKANKITYYTPTFNNFQLGFSYIPDIQAKGTIAQAKNITKSAPQYKPYGYKGIIESGIKYENDIANGTKIAASILHQHGKAKQNAANNVFRKDLNAWEIGALVKYEGFGLAGSYGDWGKSGTNKIITADNKYKASFWNLGASYEYDKFGTSVTFYKAKKANGSPRFFKTQVLSFGVDYKLAEGLLSYVEANKIKLTPGDRTLVNKSTVYLTGVILKF